MRSVFLSASIPLPDRDAGYWETADVIAIRDSIRALITVVVPTGLIVFGGHPAITPLVRLLVRGMTTNVRQHVVLYLSRHFEHRFLPDVEEFEDLRLVDAVGGNEAASLEEMRRTMISNHDFDAGIFLGGMEGVEREFEMFRQLHPNKPAFPVASTGAAALILYNRYAGDRVELLTDLRYLSLFRRLLDLQST